VVNQPAGPDGPPPTREAVESAIKTFLRLQSFIEVRDTTLLRVIRECKLDIADARDRRELLRIIQGIPPGSFNGPAPAGDALIKQYARWWENKHHECWNSR